ncbi:MAG: MBL fold metallo-hydrolase [Candidatus Nanoarchaeia archaeon]
MHQQFKNEFEKISSTKITEDIFLFKSETGCFTYYIDDKKKILIDAGVFVKKPIDLIVITHCHFDHILWLNELKKINKCKVICGVKEKEAIETLNEKVLLELCQKKLLPTKIDQTVKEGDIIEGNKFDLKVLETPGHTDGSISLFDEKRKILFSGDAWFGKDLLGKWIYPTGSEIESKKTLKKLKNLNLKILCPGHRDVIYF